MLVLSSRALRTAALGVCHVRCLTRRATRTLRTALDPPIPTCGVCLWQVFDPEGDIEEVEAAPRAAVEVVEIGSDDDDGEAAVGPSRQQRQQQQQPQGVRVKAEKMDA